MPERAGRTASTATAPPELQITCLLASILSRLAARPNCLAATGPPRATFRQPGWGLVTVLTPGTDADDGQAISAARGSPPVRAVRVRLNICGISGPSPARPRPAAVPAF